VAGPRAASEASRGQPFEFFGDRVARGTRARLEVRVARMPQGSWSSMPVVVLHGARPGPTMWVSGALHGDELNGIPITRELVTRIDPAELSGTLIAVPIVNVFGVINDSRYLPDRRDLNRSFPGSRRGSLASRLAHLFFESVVMRCSVGIDYHAGSGGRSNLSQIRGDLDDDESRRLARAFAAPLSMHSVPRRGSLREAAASQGVTTLLYETGEASRFDWPGVRIGVAGTLRVMRALGMLARAPARPPARVAHVSRASNWVRASRSGFCRVEVELGDRVRAGQTLATVMDSSGYEAVEVPARGPGIVIGRLGTALVNRGDALIHVAEIE